MADVLDRARQDASEFARVLIGQELWPHQREVARSDARYKVICAGRQVGKSRLLAVLALHAAFSRAGSVTLLISAGEVASRRLLADVAGLALSSPLLHGSIVDEQSQVITLSNGSEIRSVPASQRQIRGWAVDLLVVDEAGFIDPEIWRAAEPSIIARPGSRVILSSSPWGGADHFFRQLWNRGMTAPDEQVESWHWPSSVSPLVDDVLLERIREREPDDYFEREFLARWTDSSGAYFSEGTIMGAVADYEIPSLERIRGESGRLPLVAGLDWAIRRDANVIIGLSPLDDFGVNAGLLGEGGRVCFVSHLSAETGGTWHGFVRHVGEVAETFAAKMLVSETNGCGDVATEMLVQELRRRGLGGVPVSPIWSDVRRKQSGFARVRALLERGALLLPRYPPLLSELRALEFEQLPGGGLRIAAPEAGGQHDDHAMSLMQGCSALAEPELWVHSSFLGVDLMDRNVRDVVAQRREEALQRQDWVLAPSGVMVPRHPLPDPATDRWYVWPRGAEQAGAAW